MSRRIAHIDMDAFFAAVEVVRDPSLAGKPLIIGGTKEDLRGVVSTASYEARVFGVHSAMPLAQAKRLCPNGIFMRGNFAAYAEASRAVKEVFTEVSPLVQMASIDEAYIDVTGSQRLFGGDDAIATFIKQTIHARTGLSCTVAIGPNKLVAKVGSDFAKPDGYICVESGGEEAFFAPMPVKKLPGAGPRTCVKLQSLGVYTLGELAAADPGRLGRALGEDAARSLQRRARGQSDAPVVVGRTRKSISKETTFGEDQRDWTGLRQTVAFLTEQCMHKLRLEGLETRRIGLKVRYANFETKTYAHTLPEATAVDGDVLDALERLLPRSQERRAPVRLIGVSLTELGIGQQQMRLFEGEHQAKWGQIFQTVDRVRGRHGFDTVHLGKTLKAVTPKIDTNTNTQ